MSCGWKQGLGWDEEVNEKGSVKQTNISENTLSKMVTNVGSGVHRPCSR